MGNRQPDKPSYCEVAPSFNDYTIHPRSAPAPWNVPAARAVLLGAYDPESKFFLISARIVESILPGLVKKAYRIDLIQATQHGQRLDVGCVCLFAPERILLERDRASPKPTSVHIAVANNDIKLLELFVLNCPDSSAAVFDARDQVGRTPLHYAAARCNAEMVRALLELNANPAARDSHMQTPIQLTNHHNDKYNLIATLLSGASLGCS
eukprot:TRINITY_DN17439_c0_g1_i1.p1 TRINITY_DN17439_c0_g1~~TRINITY_DN17439_c0_g1_i1.p1  ORF type:complete len:209 (-),score=26.11 TRINITY_DN17439_c0_g1_i1:42-668(-)